MGTFLAQLAVASGGPYAPLGPAGASRYRSYVWPDPGNLGQNAASGLGALGGRNVISGQIGVSQHGFNGGSTATPALVNGLAGIQLNTTGTTGVGISFQGVGIFDLKTSRNNVSPASQDDQRCIRIWANIAVNNGCPITQDQGFFVVHPGGSGQRIIQDVGVGWGFFIGQNNVVSWMVRGPNGLVTTALTSTAGGFDITKHHSYEIIMVSATPGGDAYLFALIDGNPQVLPVASRSWSTGTNLPPNIQVSGIANFCSMITADTRIAAGFLHCQQHGIAFGPTLQSLY